MRAAVRMLAARLDDPGEKVGHAALSGLRELTGKNLGTEPEAWIAWASGAKPPQR